MEKQKYWCVRRIEDSCDSGCPDPHHDSYFTNLDCARRFWESCRDTDTDDYPNYDYHSDGIYLYECEDVDGEIVRTNLLRSKPMYSDYPDIDVVYIWSTDREVFRFVHGNMTVSEFLNAEEVKKPAGMGMFYVNGQKLTDELGNTKLCDLADGYQAKCGKVYIEFRCKFGAV